MFDTFSNLCPSRCVARSQNDMIRNVARSNNKTSSHSIKSANNLRLCSSSSTFGINL